MTFDPTRTEPQRFRGYLGLPIPAAEDQVVTDFLDSSVAAGPAEIIRLTTEASRDGRDVLLAYAERAATLAVRLRDRGAVIRALIAVEIGGLSYGSRQALITMSLIDRACRIIGCDFEDALEEAARKVGHPGTLAFATWLTRSAEDRAIEAMGYGEGQDVDGFRFRPEGRS